MAMEARREEAKLQQVTTVTEEHVAAKKWQLM